MRPRTTLRVCHEAGPAAEFRVGGARETEPGCLPLKRLTTVLCALMVTGTGIDGQVPASASVTVGSVSLHYLDFGGDGLPLVFIHAASRGAGTWLDFAPRFVDRHRVVAITARGVGESTGSPAPTERRAADILALMDSLSLQRAVFLGNSSPARDMTYLAEHHPDRVAGLVYLANAPMVEGLSESDPTGAFAHALNATQPPDPYPYWPKYLDEREARIPVRALTFVGESGTRGLEGDPYSLAAAQMVAGDTEMRFPDGPSRAFLVRLAGDEVLQAQVAEAWREHVAPAIVQNEQAFRNAFGDNLRIVELPVPVVSGYEYLSRPELIVPPIRAFLAGLIP